MVIVSSTGLVPHNPSRNVLIRVLYSAGSPFARLMRIASLETGLDARVAKREVTRRRFYSPESDVLVVNPVGACRHSNWTTVRS